MRFSSQRPLALALFVVVALLGCDTPTQPVDPSNLGFGRIVTGHLAPRDSQVFHVDAKAGQYFAVYLQSSGLVVVRLFDPSDHLVGSSFATLGDTATRRDGVAVTAAVEGRYTVVVADRHATQEADFTTRADLVNAAPEHATQSVALGGVVTGERIDVGFDEDQFIIDVPAATEAILYVHADEVPMPQGPVPELVVSVAKAGVPSTFYHGGMSPLVATSDFQQLSTGRLTLAAGKYAVTVGGAYGVAYSLQLKPIDRAPEHAPAALTPGDTISEAIDYVGDIDEYVVHGTPGTEYELFAAATGSAPHEVDVSFPDVDPFGAASTFTILDQPLLDAATTRVAMPASGELRVRVTDASDRGLYRGPYRLVAVAIDRRPEGRSEFITPSNTVIAGALEIFGDVDEYRFVLDSATRLALRCAPTPLAGCTALGAAVYNDAAPTTPVTLGAVPLPAGSYRVHIESRPGYGGPTTAHAMYRGPYQFVLAPRNPTPEDVAAALTVGTPVTESITWPWDDDTFTFDVATADTLLMHLSMADALGGTYRVDLRDAVTGADVAPTGQYGELPTEKRWPLGAGHYAVTLSASTPVWKAGQQGSYTFQLERVSAAPEGRSAEVVAGDTVDGNFDLPGDIDDYVLRSMPGEMFSLHLYNVIVPPGAFGWTSIVVRDSATSEMTADPWKTSAPIIAPPLTMPADGVLRLRVCPESGCANYIGGYAYRFSIDRVDPAPESRAAQFVFGDTVTDALEHPADVDDFTFDATAGQSIDVDVLQAPGAYAVYDGVVLAVIDDTSGEQLGRLQLDPGAVAARTNALRGLALPHTGRYRVRVQGDPGFTSLSTTGAYRFVLSAR